MTPYIIVLDWCSLYTFMCQAYQPGCSSSADSLFFVCGFHDQSCTLKCPAHNPGSGQSADRRHSLDSLHKQRSAGHLNPPDLLTQASCWGFLRSCCHAVSPQNDLGNLRLIILPEFLDVLLLQHDHRHPPGGQVEPLAGPHPEICPAVLLIVEAHPLQGDCRAPPGFSLSRLLSPLQGEPGGFQPARYPGTRKGLKN